ncbi:MAG: hypothetical protein DRI34_10070, partial [Deltaproteobacteria bacterium]
EIEYSEPLLAAGGVLRQAAGQLVLQAVQQLAQQLPPWPVSLPAGSGSLLAVRRQAGRSIIFLGP